LFYAANGDNPEAQARQPPLDPSLHRQTQFASSQAISDVLNIMLALIRAERQRHRDHLFTVLLKKGS
jgi:hypothetical protein